MEAVAAPRTQNPGPMSENARQEPLRGFPGTAPRCRPSSNHSPRRKLLTIALLSSCCGGFRLFLSFTAGNTKRKLKAEDYGLGFSTEIAAPESEVLQAVEDVVNDGIIQGSKEFNKDKYIENAIPADFLVIVSRVERARTGLLTRCAPACWLR